MSGTPRSFSKIRVTSPLIRMNKPEGSVRWERCPMFIFADRFACHLVAHFALATAGDRGKQERHQPRTGGADVYDLRSMYIRCLFTRNICLQRLWLLPGVFSTQLSQIE